MKVSLKKKVGVALAALLMTVVTGCGQSTEGTTGGKENKDDIVFWSVFTGPDGENMTRLVNEYNKTNPAIKVKHVPVEQNDLYPKIPTVVGSGKDVPDLTIVHAERIPLFVEQNVIMPLTSYIEANGEINPSNYVDTAFNVGSINGEQYSIPLDVHSFVTYYNEDLVNKYAPGILDDNILTMDEVVMASQAAAKDGIKGLGITWMRVQYLSYLAQLNGDISADGETPTLDSAESIQVLENLAKLVETNVATQDGDDPGQLFRSGQLLFWPEGIWMANSIKDIPNLNWGMTNMMTMNESNVKNWSSSHQFVMLRNEKMTDERAAAVMDFVNWAGNNGLEWAKAGQVPAHYAIRDNSEFQEMPQSFLLDNPSSLAIYDYKYYGYAVEALDKVVFEACFNRLTPTEAAQQMQKEASEKIKMAQ